MEWVKKKMSIPFNAKSVEAAPVGRWQLRDGKGLTEGLYLVVNPGGSRRLLWRYISPITGKPNEAGLGGYPQTDLASAKQTVIEWRALVRDNLDPVAERRAAKAAAARPKGQTLSDMLDAYGKDKADEAGARENVRLIKRHCPDLLTKAADVELKPLEIKAALAKVNKATPKTGARTRNALFALFEYGIAHELRKTNPATKSLMNQLMPKPPRPEPYRMTPLKLMPNYWRRLVEHNTVPSLGLAFTIATAARQAETTGMTWDDLDLDQNLWIVPSHKIKMKREHRQVLSDAALLTIERVQLLGRKSNYVFPGLGGSRMGQRTMENVQHRIMKMPFSAHATARATFSTWAHDHTSSDHETIEACIAHATGNSVSRAYNRGDQLEKRRALMQRWGEFLSGSS
jgi:integrase